MGATLFYVHTISKFNIIWEPGSEQAVGQQSWSIYCERGKKTEQSSTLYMLMLHVLTKVWIENMFQLVTWFSSR